MHEAAAPRKRPRCRNLAAAVTACLAVVPCFGAPPVTTSPPEDPWEAFRRSAEVTATDSASMRADSFASDPASAGSPQRLPPPIGSVTSSDSLGQRLNTLYGPVRSALALTPDTDPPFSTEWWRRNAASALPKEDLLPFFRENQRSSAWRQAGFTGEPGIASLGEAASAAGPRSIAATTSATRDCAPTDHHTREGAGNNVAADTAAGVGSSESGSSGEIPRGETELQVSSMALAGPVRSAAQANPRGSAGARPQGSVGAGPSVTTSGSASLGAPAFVGIPEGQGTPVSPPPLPRITQRTVDTSRLLEEAREDLQTAQRQLANHSYYSSRKSAVDALRGVVGVNDLVHRTSWHSEQLKRAMQAIREAEDFNGKFGAVDRNALKRMIHSHATEILKDADLSRITAIEATEYYLHAARRYFIGASHGRSEAGLALMFLARSEKENARNSRHAASVALAMQQVASELLPLDAQAARELAKTQLQQGLVPEARESLDHAIALEPSTEAFELMARVAVRLGDETLRQRSHLAADRLRPPRPTMRLRVLSPSEFASTSTNVGSRSQRQVNIRQTSAVSRRGTRVSSGGETRRRSGARSADTRSVATGAGTANSRAMNSRTRVSQARRPQARVSQAGRPQTGSANHPMPTQLQSPAPVGQTTDRPWNLFTR